MRRSPLDEGSARDPYVHVWRTRHVFGKEVNRTLGFKARRSGDFGGRR